jgi:hypothetical protein
MAYTVVGKVLSLLKFYPLAFWRIMNPGYRVSWHCTYQQAAAAEMWCRSAQSGAKLSLGLNKCRTCVGSKVELAIISEDWDCVAGLARLQRTSYSHSNSRPYKTTLPCCRGFTVLLSCSHIVLQRLHLDGLSVSVVLGKQRVE